MTRIETISVDINPWDVPVLNICPACKALDPLEIQPKPYSVEIIGVKFISSEPVPTYYCRHCNQIQVDALKVSLPYHKAALKRAEELRLPLICLTDLRRQIALMEQPRFHTRARSHI